MGNKKAINRHKLPVPKDRLQRTDRTSSPAHLGNLRNAIDFIADEQTPVLAAADGIVTFVKDSSTAGGSNPMYWDYTNFIVIRHLKGEYSRYYHSATVKVGQHVRAAEKIARVGMTGYTYLPHLHLLLELMVGQTLIL